MTNPNKSPLKFWRKWSVWAIQGLPKFLGVLPIISRTGKATDLDCSVSVVVGRRTSDREIASSVPGRCIAG